MFIVIMCPQHVDNSGQVDRLVFANFYFRRLEKLGKFVQYQ